jgi:hypothetical protein
MVEINTTEYLAQLLKDKKQLAAFPNVFIHLERLLDEGSITKKKRKEKKNKKIIYFKLNFKLYI